MGLPTTRFAAGARVLARQTKEYRMTTDLPGVETTLVDGVLTVRIDRAERMNAVTVETLDRMADTFEKYASDPSARVAVLTGTGRAFCTGADLTTVGELSGPPSPDMIDAANRTVAAIRAFPRPVIGAVNGPAAGAGASLALACDSSSPPNRVTSCSRSPGSD